MKTLTGCSGYYYADWKKKFYPEELPKKEWLSYYSRHFDTVEINNTFYKMPVKNDLENWRKNTSGNFKFTLKANRYFTHQKKLNVDNDFTDRLATFTETSRYLEDKLGCIFWQLPGNLHKNSSKLRDWCEAIDKRSRHVIEFRHNSWFDDEIYEILQEYGVIFCMVSAPDNLPEVVLSTANTAYVRFHGKKEWYRYFYSDTELRTWERKIKSLKKVDELFAYFNNDHDANAVKNARTLQSFLKS